MAQALPQPHEQETDVQDSPPLQKIAALSDDDLARLNDRRAFVEQYVHATSKEGFKTAAHKLALIEALLREKVIRADETEKLHSVGIVFGDAIALKTGMVWVMVDDEFGRDPALQMPKSTVIIFPTTMISKRIERGEDVNVKALAKEVEARVREAMKLEKLKPVR